MKGLAKIKVRFGEKRIECLKKCQDIHACRICGHSEHKVLLGGSRVIRHEGYYLLQCQECSFVSLYPLPTISVLEKCYDESYWVNRGNQSRALESLFALRMLPIIKYLQREVPRRGKILDWGAGDGALLKVLKRSGFECFGIDKYSRNFNERGIINTTIDGAPFPKEFFDAIICFHVLEHIRDPKGALHKALSMIRVGGIMIIEVPNISSFGFQMFKERWQPLEIPIHMNHFTPKGLGELIDIVGGAEIIKMATFSHRVSPSALVLSMFPSFSPRRVRKENMGRYPVPNMVVYLWLQILAYPFGILESILGRGAVIRMYIKKTG